MNLEKQKNKKLVIVTGAGGYIGAHTCLALKDAGYEVVGIDRNFNTAPWTVGFCDVTIQADFAELQIAGTPLEKAVGVIHIAGTSLVGPSVTDPAVYYANNVGATSRFICRLADAGFKGNFIFSSSAAVYGEPTVESIDEDQTINPISPYGQSKAMAEKVIADSARAYGFKAACLRYFNACGADADRRHGQVKGATHLIAKICENILADKELVINGNDYPTKSGTCVRDYLHVTDIAEAHVKALEGLSHTYNAYNLGTGLGWSIAEIVEHFEEVLSRKIAVSYGPRRDGDPAKLVANGTKFQQEFKWYPTHSRLDGIIATAWAWYNSDRYQGTL
jgi:UDP-glucose 4-epimerase